MWPPGLGLGVLITTGSLEEGVKCEWLLPMQVLQRFSKSFKYIMNEGIKLFAGTYSPMIRNEADDCLSKVMH